MRRALSGIRMGARRLARLAQARPSISLAEGATLKELGATGWDTFFGYYDVTPFGPGDRSLLAVRRPAGGGVQTAGTPIELGIYDLTNSSPAFRRFGESTAWCWQQSCRLQWWRSGEERSVTYNRTRAGRHEAVIQNVDSGEIERVFDRPVYSVSGDGQLAVSLNFARLHRMRPGYGYADLADPWETEMSPTEDGIWLVDLQSGDSRLLLSLAEVARHAPEPSMQGAKHYFNHLLWSPAGTRFFFLHLWQAAGKRRKSRAFVWDLASGTPRHLGAKDHFSHHWWLDEDRLVAYSTQADTGRHYHLYDLATGTQQVLSPDLLTEDGHPSVSPANRRLMVTDTYPDRHFEQHLLLYDFDLDRLLRLGRFFSPAKFRGELRCDLHPRWSRSGRLLCIDSAHSGSRRLCILDIDEALRSGGFLDQQHQGDGRQQG